MVNRPSIHNHAIERLQERFQADKEWLTQELENGRFVWLKGSGDCGHTKKVCSGHLIYIPNMNEYCVVVMDDRVRLAITVLTEEMALKSSWAKGINEKAKLKAKKLALGDDAVYDSNFLRLYAEERGELTVNVRARTVSYSWVPIAITLCKANIVAEQINPKENYCTLNQFQLKDVSIAIEYKLKDKTIRPYCELFVSTGNGKTALVSNKLDCVSGLENAEQDRRWGST